MDYINGVHDRMPDDEKLMEITEALQNFGYFLQQTIWTDHKTHAPILRTRELDEDDIAEAKAGVQDMAVVKELGTSGITKSTFMLALNSRTMISVFVQLPEGVSIASPEGSFTQVVTDGIVKYRFNTPRIGAKNLDQVYTVTVETSTGTAVFNVSAMSYVQAGLNSSALPDAGKYALAAYYYYYLCAKNY